MLQNPYTFNDFPKGGTTTPFIDDNNYRYPYYINNYINNTNNSNPYTQPYINENINNDLDLISSCEAKRKRNQLGLFLFAIGFIGGYVTKKYIK